MYSDWVLLTKIAEWQLQLTNTWERTLEFLLAVVLSAAGSSIDAIISRGASWLLRWASALDGYLHRSKRSHTGGIHHPLLGSQASNGQASTPAYGATGEAVYRESSLPVARHGEGVDSDEAYEERVASGTDVDSRTPAPPNSTRNSAHGSSIVVSLSSASTESEVEAWSR